MAAQIDPKSPRIPWKTLLFIFIISMIVTTSLTSCSPATEAVSNDVELAQGLVKLHDVLYNG